MTLEDFTPSGSFVVLPPAAASPSASCLTSSSLAGRGSAVSVSNVNEAALRGRVSSGPADGLLLQMRRLDDSIVMKQCSLESVREQLLQFAEAITTDNKSEAQRLFPFMQAMADPLGDPMQRVIYHFLLALRARNKGSGADPNNQPMILAPHVSYSLSWTGRKLARSFLYGLREFTEQGYA